MLNTSDRVCLISVDKYEVNDDGDVVKTGSETLTDYYKIELYLHTRKTPTAFAKYSIADTLPAGYLEMTVVNNKLEFTIRLRLAVSLVCLIHTEYGSRYTVCLPVPFLQKICCRKIGCYPCDYGKPNYIAPI